MHHETLYFVFLGLVLGSSIEGLINIRCLFEYEKTSTPRLMSPLGVAYGVSRFASVFVKTSLEAVLGAGLAILILFEGVWGSLNNIYEKYFIRRLLLNSIDRLLKVIYLLLLLPFLWFFVIDGLSPNDATARVELGLIALSSTLPLSELYKGITHENEARYARSSFLLCIMAASTSYALTKVGADNALILPYVLMPILTFLVYWKITHESSHNSQ